MDTHTCLFDISRTSLFILLLSACRPDVHIYKLFPSNNQQIHHLTYVNWGKLAFLLFSWNNHIFTDMQGFFLPEWRVTSFLLFIILIHS